MITYKLIKLFKDYYIYKKQVYKKMSIDFIVKRGGFCNYCGDTRRLLDMNRLKGYGLFLLGEDSRKEITVENYKKFCEEHCCHYIGAFIIDDMSDRTRGRFWDEVNDFKKKYNIESILLNDYTLLLYTLPK